MWMVLCWGLCREKATRTAKSFPRLRMKLSPELLCSEVKLWHLGLDGKKKLRKKIIVEWVGFSCFSVSLASLSSSLHGVIGFLGLLMKLHGKAISQEEESVGVVVSY